MSDVEPTNDDHAAEEAGRQAASGFRRLAIIVLGAFAVLLLVAVGTAFALYRSATAPVPEYEAVVEIEPETAETDRKEFESQLTALVSDAQSEPEWTSRVTARQINAWLAIRLQQDFPGFQQAGLIAPRVILHEGEILLAARSNASRIDGVISLLLVPVITETDELALQIASAKIGNLALPLDVLMAQLGDTPLAKLGPVRFAKTEDTASIIVDVDRIDTGTPQGIRLTGVDVRSGELLLRGETPPAAAEP